MRNGKQVAALLLLALLAGCTPAVGPVSTPEPPVAGTPAPSGGGRGYGNGTEAFVEWYDGQKEDGTALLREKGELLQAVADVLCSDGIAGRYTLLVLDADSDGEPYAVEWLPQKDGEGGATALPEALMEHLRALYASHPCQVSWSEADGVTFHYSFDQLGDAYASVVSFDLVYAPDGSGHTGAIVEELGDGWYAVGDHHAMAGI